MTTTPATIVMLNFDEPASSILMVDTMGNLGPLINDDGVTVMPNVVASYTGVGRRFATGDTGLLATDTADGSSLINRDITIEAILSFGDVSSMPWTIYQRGLDSGASEYTSARLRIGTIGPDTYFVTLSSQDNTGADNSPGQGATFHLANAGDVDQFFLFAATRRMEAARSVYRYYINGEMIGETNTDLGGGAAGSAGGSTTGTTAIGGNTDGGGGWFEMFEGVIDQLKITNYEMSAEEIEATWRRITVHQPSAVAAVNALVPPGSKWNRPATRWGKLLRIAGEAAGFVLGRVEELRDNWLPDRAYADEIPRWERIFGSRVRSIDSLDTRRARVVGLTSRENGYAGPQIQAAMAEILDLDSAAVEIVAGSNRLDDDFALGILDRRWQVVGTWSGAGLNAALSVAAAGSAAWTYQDRQPKRCINTLSSGRGRLVVEGKILASTIPVGSLIGLHLLNKRSRNALWFGVKNDAGTNKIGYVSYVDDVAGAFVSIVNAPALPLWFRIIRAPTTKASEDGASDSYALAYSTDGITFVSTTVAGLLTDPEWAGFAAYATAAIAAPGIAAVFDNYGQDTPQGTRTFVWYVYRDPGLAGSPDMIGANALIRSLRPAETHAAAITSFDVLCDNLADGGCDRGPMGAGRG